MNDELKALRVVLSNCDAKRDHNYRLGADHFTITTAEYELLRRRSLPVEDAPQYVSVTSDIGPWVVRRDEHRQWRICSENFKHDVELIITGDFKDDNEVVEYAADIARRLSTPSISRGNE